MSKKRLLQLALQLTEKLNAAQRKQIIEEEKLLEKVKNLHGKIEAKVNSGKQ